MLKLLHMMLIGAPPPVVQDVHMGKPLFDGSLGAKKIAVLVILGPPAHRGAQPREEEVAFSKSSGNTRELFQAFSRTQHLN